MQVLIALFLAVAAPEKGAICFGTECTATAGAAFEVKPADAERRFVWTSDDGSRVVLGKLAAKANSIDLAAKDDRTITVQSLRGDTQRGWPLETRFTMSQGRDALWRWAVPAKATGKPFSIRMPRGSYALLIAAEHHKTERRPLKVGADDVVLREIALAPLPVVTGRVVTMKKGDDDSAPKPVPLAGAQLARSDGKVITATNEQGAFRAELSEPQSPELVITAPGFGIKVVPLRVFAADTDLGAIELGAGVKLTVRVQRPESLESKTLHVQLAERSRAVYENTRIADRELKPGQDELVFADLSEGEYYLVLNGDGPLERLTTTIPIKSENVSKDVRIQPFQLAGSVHFGEEPLRDGTVEITEAPNHTWRTQATIDAEGRFGGTMWQREALRGWVRSKETGALPVDGPQELSGDPAAWDIRIRKRIVTGRLFDEASGQPIADAGLDLQLESKSPRPSRLYSIVQVNGDGTYSIAAVQDGVYDLTARAPEHIEMKKTIGMSDRDESKTVDFPLSAGVEQVVEFVWSNGRPVGGGQIIEGISRDGFNPEHMYTADAAGRLKLRMTRGERRTLVILPSEGSFAIADVSAPDRSDAPAVQVVVPPSAGSLRVKVDWKKASRNGPGFLSLRYNGRELPTSAVARLPEEPFEGGTRLRNLPAGAYEVAIAGMAPARATVTAGEAEVELPPQP